MDIKASIKNYNIIDTNHYIVPEIEMPLHVDVLGVKGDFFIEFIISEDGDKEKNILEEKVLKNGVEFVLINWEAGNRMIMKYPTLYLKSDDKDIYIFVQIERDRSNYYIIDLSFLKRKSFMILSPSCLNLTVFYTNDPICKLSHFIIMRYHYQGLIKLAAGVFQKSQNIITGLAIKITRWFIRQNYCRF